MKIDTLTSTSLDDPLYFLRNAEQVVRLCISQYADLLLADEVEALEQLRLQAMLQQGMPVSVLNVSWDESTA